MKVLHIYCTSKLFFLSVDSFTVHEIINFSFSLQPFTVTVKNIFKVFSQLEEWSRVSALFSSHLHTLWAEWVFVCGLQTDIGLKV